MTTDIEAAGAALARSRASGKPLNELPGGLPRDEATAIEVQASAVAAFDGDRIGYKIGATSDAAQSMLGTSHPFSAPLFADNHIADGARIPCHVGLVGIEAEYAFRLGSDLPPNAQPYDLHDVRAAVATMHPAIEIIGLRLPTELFAEFTAVVADFGANAGFVTGAAHTEWQHDDLTTADVRVTIDGVDVATGIGANVLGHPLNALLWLANDRRTSGGLTAGDWISTGTCTGLTPMTSGQEAVADFGPFGLVRLTTEP